MSQKFLVFNLQTKELIPVRSGFVFGRFVDCDIQILEKSISRKHATIEIKGDKLFLKDLGSSNGTFLNDKEITEETLLKIGDRIKIGASQFEIRLSEVTKPVSLPIPSPVPESKPEPAIKIQPKAAPAKVEVLGLAFEIFGLDFFQSHFASDEFSTKILHWEELVRAYIENHQGKLSSIKPGSVTITWEKSEIASRFLALSLARTLILGAKQFWAQGVALGISTESMMSGGSLIYLGGSLSEADVLFEKVKAHKKSILVSDSFLENWDDKPMGKAIDGLSGVVELSEI